MASRDRLAKVKSRNSMGRTPTRRRSPRQGPWLLRHGPVLSTASPMEIGATIWHRDFASLVASPMKLLSDVSALLEEPLSGEALPT